MSELERWQKHVRLLQAEVDKQAARIKELEECEKAAEILLQASERASAIAGKRVGESMAESVERLAGEAAAMREALEWALKFVRLPIAPDPESWSKSYNQARAALASDAGTGFVPRAEAKTCRELAVAACLGWSSYVCLRGPREPWPTQLVSISRELGMFDEETEKILETIVQGPKEKA